MRPGARELNCDVAIIGGGAGGIAAALSAADAGCSVIVTEPTDWIGGQLTSQAVPPDEHPWIESQGCTASYRSFRNRVRDYYRRNYPLTDTARSNPLLNPGNGFVSALCHEPRVALAVLYEMLAAQLSAGRIRILLKHQPRSVEMAGDVVRSVAVIDSVTGAAVALQSKYFIDATELGDLLQLGNIEHVIGAESKSQTGEPHAPESAQPLNQQAFTWCFATEHRENEDHTIDRPAQYDRWRSYTPRLTPPWPGRLFDWTHSHHLTKEPIRYDFDPVRERRGELRGGWLYRRIIDRDNFRSTDKRGDVTLVNWALNDYLEGPLVGVTPEEAALHLADAKQLSLSLLYWLQTECPRGDGGAGWPGLKLREDLVDTADGLAKHAYIRESRRIVAEFTILEQHVSADGRPEGDLATAFHDSIGVGSYHLDLHPSSGGDNYIAVQTRPFQIPLGALVPVRVENLIPACKNIGTTHITNGCYRLHPIEWNIGEAAGALAAYAIAKSAPPRVVRTRHLADFQQTLADRGVQLAWRPRHA